MKKICLLAMALGLAGAPAMGLAQDSEAQPEPWAMTWSDGDFAEIASALIGNWKTTEQVAVTGEDGAATEVVMSISPAKLSELPDALYVETARADSVEQPYRSAFLQFYRRQGEIRLRTLEIRGPGNPVIRMLIGLWAAPEYVPDIPRDALIATLDLELAGTSDGWVFETPYPYPTAVGGAVEMTSRMKLTGDRIEAADRGIGADGGVLWGPGEGESYVFERTEAPFTVVRDDSGVVIITLHEEEGEDSKPSDTMVVEYSGWLSNGFMFGTSRAGRNPRPLKYVIPPAGYIPGWLIGTEGMGLHDWRKLIVPPDMGYAEKGAMNGTIPPGSTLVFEVECVSLEPGLLRDALPGDAGPRQ